MCEAIDSVETTNVLVLLLEVLPIYQSFSRVLSEVGYLLGSLT